MKRFLIGAALLGVVAGVAYLATVGCCQLIASKRAQISLARGLNLTPAQKEQVASLEKSFLAQKQQSCQLLCEKRAQLIQLVKQDQPDRMALDSLVGEIGREQAALERATLEHLLEVRKILDVSQRDKLNGMITGELRAACRMTACGMTKGCALVEKR